MKRIFIALGLFFVSVSSAFGQANNSSTLAPNAIILQTAHENLVNTFFVKRFLTNLAGNGNSNFTYNFIGVTNLAGNDLLRVYPANFIGIMRYKSLIATNTVSGLSINTTYQQMITQLSKLINTPTTLSWLNVAQASALPARFYYSPAGYSTLIINCQIYNCHNELAAFYNPQNNELFGYVDLPNPQIPNTVSTYLFGMTSPNQLSLALALKARRVAEASLQTNPILSNINN